MAVLDNDTDADGDTLSVVSVSDPANGSTEIDNGATVTYTPDNGFSGKDAFNYAVSDGMVWAAARVTVTVRPERVDPTAPNAPAPPTVTAPSATTLDIMWSAPADNGSAITHYHVRYRVTDTQSWTTRTVGGTARAITIRGLRPHTAYDVQARARNGAGTGSWSDITKRTTQDIVPNQPAAPKVSAPGSSSLKVTWTAPAARGSAVSDYDVQYRKASATQWTNHAFTGAATTTTITSLDADTNYLVRVRAQNLKGESRWSAAGTARTPRDTNRAPVAEADSALTMRGEAVTIAVLDNDTDADADDTLSVASATTPGNGSAVVNANGTVTYTPWTSFVGTDTFQYTVSDGTATTSETVTVKVAQFIAIPNPSPDGDYTVRWAALTGATQYLLLEDGTPAYQGPNRSRSFTNKARGSYVYTLMRCIPGFRGVPNCRTDSGYGNLPVQVGEPLPAAPRSLVATPNPSGDGSYRVSWSASSGAARYQLEERLAGSWSGLHDAAATRTDVSGRSITGATPYRYRVRGCAGSADATCGPWSAELSVAVTGTVTATPNPSTDGRYTVRWTPSPVATRYKLDESTDGGATWPTVYAVTGTQRAFTGKADDTYTYRVRACFDLTLPLAGSRETCAPLIPTRPDATLDVVVAGRLAPPTVTVTPEVAPDGGYRVSWPASAGARSYVLQERTEGGNWSTVTGVTGRAKSFTGRAVAVYDYQVKACATRTDCGIWSPAATVRVPPAVPAGLTVPATDADGSYTVSWTASTGADRYVLEESADAGANWTAVAKQSSDAATSRAVEKASDGTFAYRVKACRGTDNCGAWSGSHTVTVRSLPRVTIGACENGRYTISWSTLTGTTRYELQQRIGDGNWSFVYRNTGTSTKRALDVGTTYSFRARSCRTGAGCTAWGPVVSLTATKCIGVPTGFGVDAMGRDDYTLEWNTVTNAARYELERSANGGNWTNVQDGTLLSKAYENEPEGTYRYRVRACPATGDCGDYAAPVSVTVPIPTPVPQNVRVSELDDRGRHTVSWDDVSFGRGVLYLVDQVHRNNLKAHIAPGTSRAIPAPTPGDYAYSVKACLGFSHCSDNSASVTVTVPPPAPQNLAATDPDDDGDYTVSWEAVSFGNNVTYVLQERMGAEEWADVHDGAEARKAITGKTGGTYDYRVRICAGTGNCGEWSDTLSVTVASREHAWNLAAEYEPHTRRIRVSWSGDADYARYELRQTVALLVPTPPNTLTPTIPLRSTIQVGTDTSHATLNPLGNTRYAYDIRGCNGASDCGDWSAPITIDVRKLKEPFADSRASRHHDGAGQSALRHGRHPRR